MFSVLFLISTSRKEKKKLYPGNTEEQWNLKHTPPLLPPLAIPPLLPTTHHTLLPLLQLTQPFHLLEHMLEQVFATHDIEMTLDLWIFLCETLDFVL